MTGDIIEATEASIDGKATCTVAWVDPTLMRAALISAFKTIHLNRAILYTDGLPCVTKPAELADALAPLLATEMGRRIK